MNSKIEIVNLLEQKQNLETKLQKMIYGSIEIRKKNSNKYIYVHVRESGILLTKYVGEYSDELYNLILKNTIESKNIKKEIREINKKLKDLNYFDIKLNDDIKTNIDFAKRHLVDSIYKQAMLEGVVATYADTENIVEGGKVNNMTTEDVLKIVNLKHAWEFILDQNVILAENNLSLICEVNKLVEEGFYYSAGILRSTPVNIGGTKWRPSIPVESQIKEELNQLEQEDISDLEKAINLLLYIMKKQIFIDGNKRTAIIIANHLLISKALGIISIPEELIEDYKKLLISYYEVDDKTKIFNFLKEKCYISIK